MQTICTSLHPWQSEKTCDILVTSYLLQINRPWTGLIQTLYFQIPLRRAKSSTEGVGWWSCRQGPLLDVSSSEYYLFMFTVFTSSNWQSSSPTIGNPGPLIGGRPDECLVLGALSIWWFINVLKWDKSCKIQYLICVFLFLFLFMVFAISINCNIQFNTVWKYFRDTTCFNYWDNNWMKSTEHCMFTMWFSVSQSVFFSLWCACSFIDSSHMKQHQTTWAKKDIKQTWGLWWAFFLLFLRKCADFWSRFESHK